MTNCNPTSGIRYGVISCQSLDGDLDHELWYGSQAVNLTESDAYADARDEFWSEAEDAAEGNDDFDREEFVDAKMERFSDFYQEDEPIIEGELEGVKYRTAWLGGAPLLWVLEGPIGYANELCSPCVPNAANLDGGFSTGESPDGSQVYTCYVVPNDWLRKE